MRSRRRGVISSANSSLGPLTNVQINVIDAEESMSAPGNVEVIGQIAGPGVRHAGVYVNGRLAKSIPVSTSGYSAFDLTFPMPAGSDARIRAYGNGNDFVEASIDTVGGGGGMTEYRNPPMYRGAVWTRIRRRRTTGRIRTRTRIRMRRATIRTPRVTIRTRRIRIRMDTRRPATARRRTARSVEAVVHQTVPLVRAMKSRHAAALALVGWYLMTRRCPARGICAASERFAPHRKSLAEPATSRACATVWM